MNQMAEEGIEISGGFLPSKKGLLGKGVIAFTYKGFVFSFLFSFVVVKYKNNSINDRKYFAGVLLRQNSHDVAMKFTPYYDRKSAMEEYEIYTYLGSLHVRSIESYGIPKVYYFGQWEEYMMMGLTLLDFEFSKRANAGLSSGQLNEVDILIVFREFVSKN